MITPHHSRSFAVRLPVERIEEIRRVAFQRRITSAELIRRGIDAELAR